MSELDLAALREPIDSESPSGENLEYDPLFLEMERAAEGKPEQQMGDEVSPGEEPDWSEVRSKALELASRTKDLRVGVYLAKATARTDGLPSLRDSLELLRIYITEYWETVHPQLDPDDNMDPTMRVNALAGLEDQQGALAAIRETPLVTSPLVGQITYRHILMSRGEASPRAGEEPPTTDMVNGAFSELETEELTRLANTCREAAEISLELEAALTKHVGAANAVDMSGLPSALNLVHGVLADILAARGVTVEGAEELGQSSIEGDSPAGSGAIRTRDDVVLSLERIIQYYSDHEPSSPLPMLLERAKSLVHSGFVDLIRELAPEGMSQVDTLRGHREEE